MEPNRDPPPVHPMISSVKGGKTYLRANGKILTITLPPNGKYEVSP